jgi:ferredoxin
MNDDKPMDRRRFFRQGLRELFKPLAKAVEPIERVAEQLKKMEEPAPPPVQGTYARGGAFDWATPAESESASEPLPDHWLRPPGALDERDFLDTCSRCRACVENCPAHCIELDPTGVRGDGAPYIEPTKMACVLCTGLRCMTVCPSGALLPTPIEQIKMGTAEWYPSTCVRPHGQDCTICVDHCPVGPTAITATERDIHVHAGCVGCGVCQHECPTNPKSIVVLPIAASQGGMD